MQAYELKRGFAGKIEGGRLKDLVASLFGTAETAEGGKVVASFGAIRRLVVWTDGKQLYVETEMNPGVPDDVARQTITAYNRFLEDATGYDAKARAKKAQARAKGKA